MKFTILSPLHFLLAFLPTAVIKYSTLPNNEKTINQSGSAKNKSVRRPFNLVSIKRTPSFQTLSLSLYLSGLPTCSSFATILSFFIYLQPPLLLLLLLVKQLVSSRLILISFFYSVDVVQESAWLTLYLEAYKKKSTTFFYLFFFLFLFVFYPLSRTDGSST